MGNINKKNFFKSTYCEFKEITHDNIQELELQFHSKSNSKYFYTEEGVYRYANHWGRVANCRWRLKAINQYKNQQYYLAYAKWTDFVSLNTSEKIFSIEVDYKNKQVFLNHNTNNNEAVLYSITEVQKKEKEILKLLQEDSWSKYFTEDIQILRKKIISEYITSHQTLNDIKRKLL